MVVLFFLVLIVSLLLVVLQLVLADKSNQDLSSFESGFLPLIGKNLFNLQFASLILFFIIFDLELIFLSSIFFLSSHYFLFLFIVFITLSLYLEWYLQKLLWIS